MKAGEPVNIPADVTGLPMPKIEWSKNEKVIEKPTDALNITKEEVSRSEAKTELSIPKAVREDKGTYTITASNRLGSVFRNVHVEVYGKRLARPVGKKAASGLRTMSQSHPLFLPRPPISAQKPRRH